MSVRYESRHESGGSTVYVVDGALPSYTVEVLTEEALEAHEEVQELDPRTDLANHSPTGFAWGYRGSGPAQLALAILAHHGGDQYALEHYQTFKDWYVAKQPADERFKATEEDVDEVIGR